MYFKTYMNKMYTQSIVLQLFTLYHTKYKSVEYFQGYNTCILYKFTLLFLNFYVWELSPFKNFKNPLDYILYGSSCFMQTDPSFI